MRELLLGCGNSRVRKLFVAGEAEGWDQLVTLDHDPRCGADVVHDLEQLPWPFEDGTFDAVHAYEVLEHLGVQGDARAFFAHFGEIWRVLRPDGMLFATVPLWTSQWAWGDPSHRRVIAPGTLVFLSQEQYRLQVGVTPMTDFRWLWQGDFEAEVIDTEGETLKFLLRAVKPARLEVTCSA
jgi:SAM-dependent methyltransferase